MKIFIVSAILAYFCTQLGNSIIYDTSPHLTPQELNYQIQPEPLPSPSGIEPQRNTPATIVSINTPNINSQESRNLPLEVRKRVLERSKDSYLVNEAIWILVDINTVGDLWPEDIELLEAVDKHLKITSYSGYYITDSINDTIPFDKAYNHAPGLNNKNNTIYIHILGLKPKQHILYKYCINPNKAGLFNAETILRFGTAESFKAETVLKTGKAQTFFPDSYYPLEIPVIEPDFDIKVDIDKTEVEPRKDMNLTYLVTYNSRNQNVSETHNFTAKVGSLIPDNKAVIKPNNFTLSFDKNKGKSINKSVHIHFKEQGIYNIPEITINDSTYFIPNGQIKVQTWFDKWMLEITLIVTFFALLAHPYVELLTTLKKDNTSIGLLFRRTLYRYKLVKAYPKARNGGYSKRSSEAFYFKWIFLYLVIAVIMTLAILYILWND